MALNNPVPTGAVRSPRAIIMINNVQMVDYESFEVANNVGHFVSDTFHIRLPLYSPRNGFSFADWQSNIDLVATISVGFSSSAVNVQSPVQLIIGPIDRIDVDVMEGIVEITGRDYSGVFIETVIDQKDFLNATSSQAVQQIITLMNQTMNATLTGNITTTTNKIGIYTSDANASLRLANRGTAWDLITELAALEGFITYVTGTTLYFGPPPQQDSPAWILGVSMPSSLGPPILSNAKHIKLTRSLTIATDVKVTVRSGNSQTRKIVYGTAQAVNPNRGNRAGGPRRPAQQFNYNIAGLTQDQANVKALALAQQITKHERLMSFTLPGDTSIMKYPMIQLQGTGTQADQTYFIDRIDHRFSMREGYEMEIATKNHSPTTQYGTFAPPPAAATDT